MAVRFTQFRPLASILVAVAVLYSEGVAPAADPTLNTSSKLELDSVLAEGIDPARIDRRPGFSTITYAQPDSLPAASDVIDVTPAQAGEAESDSIQR